MSKVMKQIPFDRLMDWAVSEYGASGALFGVGCGGGLRCAEDAAPRGNKILGERLEFPFGPAAGPHTQLAQNLVAAYAAGGRFFELKTVQTLDGEDLPVSKPCILAKDEGYNVEWSTELYVPQAMDEYIKGWFAVKMLSREFGLGDPDGFVFNMSVGYDLEGIKSDKIDGFIEGLKNAEDTEPWRVCKAWALENLTRFKNVDRAFVEGISPRICRSVTLSTLHGCPPDEIERIASYLLTEKGINTFIKCNPTLLGYEYARNTLDRLGFDYIAFDDHHFKNDLQFDDAVPMIKRLISLADSLSLTFGVKLTNTFPVKITAGELPGGEMYMSGRSLFPLSAEVANRLSKAFGGDLRISFSGGADIHNIDKIVDAGIWPVTLATTLLKPGGYTRLRQIAELLGGRERKPRVDLEKLQALVDWAGESPLYRKPFGMPAGRKLKSKLPMFDCFTAPCRGGCPLEQDVPKYLRLAGEGKHLEALRVITERNPLPFITGTICPQHCADKCTREFYEGAIRIRDVKLEAAERAFEELLGAIEAPVKSREKIAVIGGGPAGLSAAFFLARAGYDVTVFEKRGKLGGIPRHVIPAFRIGGDAVDRDEKLVRAMGVNVELNREITDLDGLRAEGFDTVIAAVGAWKAGVLNLEGAVDALVFLENLKKDPKSVRLGENVAVIGGGNTAMDAARAAKRAEGVKNVSLVYRRTKRYMPADGEELELAVKDGVAFRELLSPLSLKDGVLTCGVMKLGEPDASGRRVPEAAGETVEIPADTVISAVGNLADNGMFEGEAHIIGDAKRGPSTVAEAVADALKCAEAIIGAKIGSVPDRGGDEEKARKKKGILYRDRSAVSEAERCLDCAAVCECCVDVCPNRANIAVTMGGKRQIVHIDSLCNECGNCEAFCPHDGAPYREKLQING